MDLFWQTQMTRRGQERLRREVGTRTKDTTWFPFGKSILGEPLLCARRGQGSPAMLFVGVHHGMEHLTGNLLYAFLASDRLPPGTYYVVPCLNPDGAALELGGWDPASLLADRQLRMNGGSRDFSRWQANARGVDLNHNYPAGFAAYRTVERALGIEGGAPTRYSGEYPLSEPETQALMGLIDILAPDAVLTLYAGARTFLGCRAPSPHAPLGEAPCPSGRLSYRCPHRRGGIRGPHGYARGEGDPRTDGRMRLRSQSPAVSKPACTLAGGGTAPYARRRVP